MIFGTDGIRGLVNNWKINNSSFFKLGMKYGTMFKGKNVIVSHDTRESSYSLTMSFISGLLKYCNVIYVQVHIGGLSKLIIKDDNIDAGAMITASHNMYQFNGIKFLNHKGEKIHFNVNMNTEAYLYGKLTFKHQYQNLYSIDILNSIKNVQIDCGNGALSYVNLLHNKINDQYNGYNINTYKTIDNNIEYILRTDGDGDRFSLYHFGKLIHNDSIIATIGQNSQNIIGTVMSSLALRRFCMKRKIHFHESNVGDINIYNIMKNINETVIGGEPSGHILFQNTVSDPIMTLYHYLNTENKIHLTHDYSLEENVQGEINTNMQLIIAQYKNHNTNIVIRNSGTEDLLRIKVESIDKILAKSIMKQLLDCI